MDKVKAGAAKKYSLDPRQIVLLRTDGNRLMTNQTMKVNGMEAGKTYFLGIVQEQEGGHRR